MYIGGLSTRASQGWTSWSRGSRGSRSTSRLSRDLQPELQLVRHRQQPHGHVANARRSRATPSFPLGPSSIDGTAVQGYSVTLSSTADQMQLATPTFRRGSRRPQPGRHQECHQRHVYIDGSGLLRRYDRLPHREVASSRRHHHARREPRLLRLRRPGHRDRAPPADQVMTFQQFLQAAEPRPAAEPRRPEGGRRQPGPSRGPSRSSSRTTSYPARAAPVPATRCISRRNSAAISSESSSSPSHNEIPATSMREPRVRLQDDHADEMGELPVARQHVLVDGPQHFGKRVRFDVEVDGPALHGVLRSRTGHTRRPGYDARLFPTRRQVAAGRRRSGSPPVSPHSPLPGARGPPSRSTGQGLTVRPGPTSRRGDQLSSSLAMRAPRAGST